MAQDERVLTFRELYDRPDSDQTWDLEIISGAVDCCVDINADIFGDTYGFTPLLYLAGTSRLRKFMKKAIKMVICAGADVNIRTSNKIDALRVAFEYTRSISSDDTVKVLLDYGSDVQARDLSSWPILAYWSWNFTTLKSVKLLIDAGGYTEDIFTFLRSRLDSYLVKILIEADF